MVRRLLRRLLLLWYRLGTRSGGSVSLRETLPIEASGEASQQAIPDMTSKPNMPPATRTALAATRSPWQGVVAWVMLDWAGSAFSTLSITLLVAYFERVVFETNPWGLPGGVWWAWTLAFAMLVTALVAPLWAAWADRHRSLRTSLLMSVLLGSGACVLLGVIPPTSQLAVALLVVAATVGFDLSAIFTGSLLPEVAQGRDPDRLSATGFAAGYAGGALALLAATGIVAARERLGLSTPGALQASCAFVGIWWLAFSLPAICRRSDTPAQAATAAPTTQSLASLVRSLLVPSPTLESRRLGGVLLGSMVILGAVQTAISQFSSVALEEFHLDAAALVRLVLLVQMVALPGALAVGWISQRVGRRAALTLCLAGWTAVLLLAVAVRTEAHLTALAVLLALVLGGVQSVLRASVAVLTPPGNSGSVFGLLQVGSKLAGCVSSLLFGAAYAISGLPRLGLVAILVPLVAGWWLVARAGAAHNPKTSRIE